MLKRLLVLATITQVLLGSESFGSPCGYFDPPEVAFEKTTVVFGGVLIEKIRHSWSPDAPRLAGMTEYVFRTGQVWKGPLFEEFRVFSRGEHFGLFGRFRIGQHYLVYCLVEAELGDLLVTEMCMRNNRIDRALVDRVVLRDPYVVDPELVVERPTESELIRLSTMEHNPWKRTALQALGELRERNEGVEVTNGP